MDNKLKNKEIAKLLRECAISYELSDPSKYRFQALAYKKSADAIEALSEPLTDYASRYPIEDLPGVGKSIAAHLNQLIKVGTSDHLESVRKMVPEAVFTLIEIPGIGPKKAIKLVTNFNLTRENSLEKLRENLLNNKVAQLEGFGDESQKDILEALENYLKRPPTRHHLDKATAVSESVVSWILKFPQIDKVNVLGSLRRKSPSIGDIDISIATTKPKEAFDHIVSFPSIEQIIERGDHSTSFVVGGIQIDVMVQPTDRYGSLLQHFTGSKYHNVALREYALERGLSLSEYGIKPLDGKTRLKLGDLEDGVYKYGSEEGFYADLGLQFVPPELRENRGEIPLAEKNSLPRLVEIGDIKADLHMHSSFDVETSHDLGANTFEEMARVCQDKGYRFMAFTEHNPSQKAHSGQDFSKILRKKGAEIKKVQTLFPSLKLFNSLEIDITPDGSLAIPDSSLDELDFALVSIHSSFTQTKEEATSRVLKALSHPKVLIFAHPTGRIIGKREGVSLDWDQIFNFCLENKKILEINSSPDRLDLPDDLIKEAVDRGVLLSIDTDAHSLDGLELMHFGVSQARRGWCESKNIVNTWELSEFESLLS